MIRDATELLTKVNGDAILDTIGPFERRMRTTPDTEGTLMLGDDFGNS